MVHRAPGLLHESVRLAGDRGGDLPGGLPVRRERAVGDSLHGLLHRDHVPDVHVRPDEDLRRRRLHRLLGGDLPVRRHQRSDPAGHRVHQRVHRQRVGLPLQRAVHGHPVRAAAVRVQEPREVPAADRPEGQRGDEDHGAVSC